MSSTHFGFKTVDETEKAKHVRGVFDSVASKYDVMNDLMSMGLHRVWKAYTVQVANLKEGDQVLDIAGGTGDLSMAFAKKVGATGRVVHTDINEAMLSTGRDRLVDHGLAFPRCAFQRGQRGFWIAQYDPQRRGVEGNVPSAQAGWEVVGARVFQSGQTPGKSLRLVQLQDTAPVGQAGGG
jgi:demethylmenaquinone methyltransferase/2-methoxy-6-polyprenyl-1,4-benzoquinol methylase